MFSILGGIGLIFFGVRFLRKGLDRLFGGKLMVWLSRVTDRPVKAFMTGLGIGTVAPSSTGASLMTVQMLNSGKTEPSSMLAVLLGTNVGITVAVQLLAFRVQDYAGLMIFGGIIGFQFLKRDLFRGIGQCVLALGFVFLAIDIIGTGARVLSADGDVKEAMHVFAVFPWILLAATAGLSMFLQSSTASIGLGIAMASGGLFEGSMLGWWVIGTNLGVGLTSMVAAWSTVDGRRMGIANLLIKLFVAVVLLTVPGLLDAVFHVFPGSMERQTAMFHTDYNLLVALVALPLLAPIWKMIKVMIPDETADHFAPGASYLDDKALETPSLALARASRECMRMAEHVRFMLEQFRCAYSGRDAILARRVQKEDDNIDAINLSLKDYLIRLGDDLPPGEVQWQFALHGISSELEAIGDVLDKHLCDLLIKQVQEGVAIRGRDEEMLDEAFNRILIHFERGIGLLTTRDPKGARDFLFEKEKLNDWLRAIQTEHYTHLSSANRGELASSASFLDMVNGIRRINGHISTIGYAFAGTPQEGEGYIPEKS